MSYQIILYDMKQNTVSEVLECHYTKKKAEKAVKEYRKQGLPAFYKKEEQISLIEEEYDYSQDEDLEE